MTKASRHKAGICSIPAIADQLVESSTVDFDIGIEKQQELPASVFRAEVAAAGKTAIETGVDHSRTGSVRTNLRRGAIRGTVVDDDYFTRELISERVQSIEAGYNGGKRIIGDNYN
jgi:hypothetical protein